MAWKLRVLYKVYLGMFPFILTILGRDDNREYSNPYLGLLV